MKYSIGLDCGIKSVGYSVLELNEEEEPIKIIDLGVRIFPAPEVPKTRASLTAERRLARGTRRRLRRHRHRLERIRSLILNIGLLTPEELENLYNGVQADVYELRTRALDYPLEKEEFAKVLIHIAQRRGFKSNRKKEKNSEDGKLLKAVGENDKIMAEKHYRTIGEMMHKDEKFKDFKRNKGEKYANTVSREQIEKEMHEIFKAQRGLGNKFATEETEEAYCGIALSQRSFDEGPGGNSKYGGNQIEIKIGKCRFYGEEPRAVSASYSFQLFTLLQNINNIRIESPEDYRPLTAEEREKVRALAFKTENLSYHNIRKELGLSDKEYFGGISYQYENKKSKKSKQKAEAEPEKAEVTEENENITEKAEQKAKFQYLAAYHHIRKALDKVKKGRINDFKTEQLNEIGYIFTVHKTDEKIVEALYASDVLCGNRANELGNKITSGDVEALLELPSFTKVGHISVMACDKIIPYLEEGMKYNEACEAAGINFRAHNDKEKTKLLSITSEIAEISNPVVRRAISQTIKVINAIIREQGDNPPVYINIELTREMHKTAKERQECEKLNEKNRAANEKAKAAIAEHFKKIARGEDIVKYRLYTEQNGICPYSRKAIDFSRLLEQGYVEVDHIVPYSISLDDSRPNKVLVFARENRQKGNRLPLQYLQGKDREDFIVYVKEAYKGYKKKLKNLLKESISDGMKKEFIRRNLQDTSYLSTFLYNYINDNLEFAEAKNYKTNRVIPVNGVATAYMRKRWGIQKIRENGDLHHAVDATVVACVTKSMIQRITKHSHNSEISYIDADDGSIAVDSKERIVGRFPLPWPEFRQEIEMRIDGNPKQYFAKYPFLNYSKEEKESIEPCFVSRMANHKLNGAAHKETLRSARDIENGNVISKVALADLKLGKDGEIEYYYNPSSDRLLYEALKKRLEEFGGNGKEAFKGYDNKNPFRKPTNDGSEGPIVKKVKRIEKATEPLLLNNGTAVAQRDNMIRIDVFYVENDGYYFVPIYVCHTIQDSLPNKACVAKKPYKEWKEMKEEDFIFSLYSDDLVKIVFKKERELAVNIKGSTLPKKLCKETFAYYKYADIASGAIIAITHDAAYLIRGIGIKTLVSLEKYQVDMLGNKYKVGKEKRQAFKKMR